MKIHRNAKTPPAARAVLVHRVLHENWTNAATAAAFAVSERTVAKWVQRYRAGGRAALEDGSSRPGPAPHQTPARVVAVIRHLRVEQGLPAWAIAGRGPSPLDRECLAAPVGPQPAAGGATAPRAPLRVAAARRLAPCRYQALGPDLRCRPSDPRRPPAHDEGGGLGVCARGHRRPQSGGLRRGRARPARRDLRGLSHPQRRVVCGPRGHGPSGHERQRQRLRLPVVPSGLPCAPPPPPPDAPLHAPDEWQGGALYPNAAPRMGVRRRLSVLAASYAPTRTLLALLQPTTTTCEPGLSRAVVQASECCLMNNVLAPNT